MAEVKLYPANADGELIDRFRQDLNAEVGSTELVQGTAAPHSKGAGLPEVLGIAVTLATTPAVLRLIELLKAYLTRDKSFEITIEHEGRKVHLKSSDLSSGALERIGSTLIAASRPK